jgi:hypothetical protein
MDKTIKLLKKEITNAIALKVSLIILKRHQIGLLANIGFIVLIK